MKKKSFYTVLILLIVLILSLGLAACEEPDFTDKPDNGAEVDDDFTRTQILKNGTFYKASQATGSTSYVKANVSDWTINSGTLTSSDDGVVRGVIDLGDKKAFEDNRSIFSINNTMAYKGIAPNTPYERDDATKLQDTNALVLASVKQEGSIYYTSSAATIEKGKYYRLQFSVLTDITSTNTNGDKGAWVIVDGAIYAEFPKIDTNGEWKTYELYIEANNYENRTFTMKLWLGHGPSKALLNSATAEINPYLTKGAVLFDNIICEEITATETQTPKQIYDSKIITDSSVTQKVSILHLPDLGIYQQKNETISSTSTNTYSFRSGTTSTSLTTEYSNTANFTLIKGKSDLTSNVPTVDGSFLGIVDLSKMYYFDAAKEGAARFINTYNVFNAKSSFVAPNRADFMTDTGVYLVKDKTLPDTKALMIYHNDLSGAGFKTAKSLLIEKNKYYKISVDVYVWSKEIPEYNGTAKQPTRPDNSDSDKPESTEEAIENANNALTAKRASFITAAVTYLYKLQVTGDTAGKDSILAAITDSVLKQDITDELNAMTGDASPDEIGQLRTIYLEHDNEYKNAKKLVDDWTTYTTNYNKYILEYNSWFEKYEQWRSVNQFDGVDFPKAHAKVTGAGDVEAQYTTALGWNTLEFYIQGNQLSDRKVNLEFWFGEGSANDYTTLMLGGAFFDNTKVVVQSEKNPEKDYTELTPFTEADEYDIGGLISKPQGTEIKFADDPALGADEWSKEIVSGVALDDKAFITAAIVDGGTQYPITISGITQYYNILKLTHSDYTASILELIGTGAKTVNPNTCYRFSMWVRTSEVDKNLGATIDLMSKKKDSEDDFASVSSVTSFNNEEWKEVVFYIQGDSLVSNLIALQFNFGTGTRFNTTSYIKGSIEITAITLKEIKYSEYNATTKTGDYTKSYAFSNTASASMNGNFGGISLADVKETDIDENGNLIGVAAPTTWTRTTVNTNFYNQPTVTIETEEGKFYLEWKGTVDAENNAPLGYEIYASGTKKQGSDETVDNLYIGYVDSSEPHRTVGSGTSEEKYYRFEIKSYAKANLTVKPVGANGVGTVSAAKANTATDANGRTAAFAEYGLAAGETIKREYFAGTINYEKYAGKNYADDYEYANLFAGSDYVSPYKTVLMLSSNYGVRVGMKATSGSSLAANSFYEIRVWMKTVGNDTKASITFEDISDVLSTEDTYAGYVDQNTNGKWVQYRFVVATGDISETYVLVLSLGNPYAKGEPVSSGEGSTSTTTMYRQNALSTGTVFFDNVVVNSLTEEQFKKYKEGEFTLENGTSITAEQAEYFASAPSFVKYEMVYENLFAFKHLAFTVDSFDSFTENTKGEGEVGHDLGDTPNAYTWSKATGVTDTDDDRMYGVYSYKDITSNDHPLMTNDTHENPFESFLPENFSLKDFIAITGDHSLVMSNLINYGQKYTYSTTKSIAANTYYKITFKAKVLVPAGKFAALRFYSDTDNNATNYDTLKITAGDDIYEAKDYTFYIYNANESTSKSIKWAFALGGDSSEERVMGMLVVDDVRFTTIDKTEYEDAQRGYNELDSADKQNAPIKFLKYDKQDGTSGTPEDPTEEEEPKTTIFDKGEIWLLVSSIVIGLAIIATVVVVIVKRVKKKVKRPVKGENVVKTEKVPYEVIAETKESSRKEDIEERAEFVDSAETPKYVQRVTGKSKKKSPYKKK